MGRRGRTASDSRPHTTASLPPLDLLKTIGDDTRYAILVAIAGAAGPMTALELADALGLHPNTIRPHLDRMREAGFVMREIAADGGVGRPRHEYRIADDAPIELLAGDRHADRPGFESESGGAGLEPLLVRLATSAGATDDQARRLGFTHGSGCASNPDHSAAGSSRARPGLDTVLRELDRLGFGPTTPAPSDGDDVADHIRIDFTCCPFEDGTEHPPDIACSLHEGIVAGLAAERLDGTGVTMVTNRSQPSGCHALVAVPNIRYDSQQRRSPRRSEQSDARSVEQSKEH